jgi:hypothetical protein
MGRDDTDTYCGRIEVLYPELELVVSIKCREVTSWNRLVFVWIYQLLEVYDYVSRRFYETEAVICSEVA